MGAERSVQAFDARQRGAARPVRLGRDVRAAPRPHPPAGAAARSRSRPRARRGARSRRATRRTADRTPRFRGACRRRGSTSRRTRCRAAPPVRRSSGRAHRPSRAHALEAVLAVAYSQLPSSCATPPGSRCSAAPRITASTIASPTMPPSRYSYSGTPARPRRDHERRVRDDPVEALPRDGLVEAPEPELDALDPVQLDVQSGEVQRTPRDVGRDDALGEPRRVHRLDAAAGAEVEHGARRRRQHQARQRHRRTADAEHVLLAERVAECDLPEVGQDPPVALPRGVDERVRPQVEQGPHGCRGGRARRLRPAEQPELDRAVHPERRQRVLRIGGRHREPEHEQLRERRQIGGCPVRGAPRVEHASRRHALAAMQRGRGIRAPQRLECRDREVGRGEVVAEAGEQVARARAVLHGVDAHRTIQPHGPPADPTGRPARTARAGIAAGRRPLSGGRAPGRAGTGRSRRRS